MSNKRQPNPTKLTPKQERAAELLAAGQRPGDVAIALRIHRVTLWDWTRRPGFQVVLNELRRAAWRSAADQMRQNTSQAAVVLGEILGNSAATARDRIAAARVVLAAAGPLYPEPGTGMGDLEGRGVPQVVPREPERWEVLARETARVAGVMAGNVFMTSRTPGAARVESGLEAAFPESFAKLQSLAADPDAASDFCARILAEWRDALDLNAIEEAEEGRAATGD